jgi:hypothetical protein
MATKGIFCLEGLWDNDLKRKSTVQPILNMLEVNDGVKYIHQDVATIEELEFYLKQWKQQDTAIFQYCTGISRGK